jgi:hypothetical protein
LVWPTLCLIVLFVVCPTALAQQQQRDPAKEAPILEELQKIAPKAVETFKKATTDLDSDKNEDAIREFNDVLKQAPNFEPALRRLGYAFVAVGKQSEGVASTQKAVDLHRSADNLLGLAVVLLGPKNASNDPPKADVEKALNLATESSKVGNDSDPDALSMIAQLSLALDRMDSFNDATTKLNAKFPDLLQSHYFRAISLADYGKYDEASAEMKKAVAAGMPQEEADQFNAALQKARDEESFGLAGYTPYLYPFGGIVALWAVGLGLLFVTGKVLSTKTLRSIENSDPNDITGGGQAGLRKFYRRVITLAGVYYYVSQPVVIVVIVAATVGVVLFFLIVGWIPIKLLLILGFVGAASIFYMLKSLFVRPKEEEDPGRPLSESEAPGVWSLAREVAEAVGTRSVDEIRITEGTDLAVYERGSWRKKMRDKAQRILIVGAANLNDFRQNAFRAVLAHEYGHFTNRDTAGGEIAYRVNTDMLRLAQAMVLSGTNTTSNLAFHFIRLYHFLFRRITHGATRLQETLADRVAARHYGFEAFREGLTHVVKREVEFGYLANKEINSARAANRPFNNLYDLSSTDESGKKEMEEQFQEAMNRETTDDDTHPSPNDRFRRIENVTSNENLAIDGMVWDLFTDRQALTDEMNKSLESKVGAKYRSSHDIIK